MNETAENKKIYRVALCDDDPRFCEACGKLLEEVLRDRGWDCSPDVFSEPEAFLRAVLAGMAPYDLLLIDVLLGGKNGVELAKALRKKGVGCDLAFISVTPDFALEGYEAEPLHYLTKPVTREKLAGVIDRALKRRRGERALIVRTKAGICRVAPSGIRFITISDRMITLFTDAGKMECIGGTLEQLERELPPGRFLRCHKGYLVNLARIKSVRRYLAELDAGSVVPIGKSHYAEVQNAFIEYVCAKSPGF